LRQYLGKIHKIYVSFWAAIAQSVQRLLTGWMVRGSNPGGGRARYSAPVQTGSAAQPAPYTMGYRVFPSSAEVKGRVELCLYSHSGTSWHVLACTLRSILMVLSKDGFIIGRWDVEQWWMETVWTRTKCYRFYVSHYSDNADLGRWIPQTDIQTFQSSNPFRSTSCTHVFSISASRIPCWTDAPNWIRQDKVFVSARNLSTCCWHRQFETKTAGVLRR